MMTMTGDGDKSRISNVKYKTDNFFSFKIHHCCTMKSFITSCVRGVWIQGQKSGLNGLHLVFKADDNTVNVFQSSWWDIREQPDPLMKAGPQYFKPSKSKISSKRDLEKLRGEGGAFATEVVRKIESNYLQHHMNLHFYLQNLKIRQWQDILDLTIDEPKFVMFFEIFSF